MAEGLLPEAKIAKRYPPATIKLPMKTTKKRQQAAQVYFPISMYIQIKQIAKEENKPLAAWIRDLVEVEITKKGVSNKAFKDLPSFDDTFEPFDTDDIDKIVYNLN